MTILKNDYLEGQAGERMVTEHMARLAMDGKLKRRNWSTVVVPLNDIVELDDPVALILDVSKKKMSIESFDLGTFEKTNEYSLLINANDEAKILDLVYDCLIVLAKIEKTA